MVEAGVRIGYPRTDDLNDLSSKRVLVPWIEPSRHRVAVQSTARGYLDLAKQRPNLTIITHAMTHKILFSLKQAVGVEYFQVNTSILD